ncbi:ROK family transcriptional regulator [Bacillus shivajii]|uniref:ROK family transcriptional regulator n=1 Tax=Bacillus shivajii TaxID=1983719 RepID=UPI001CFAF7D6|nr:ROK family transcriptional regulator [Bacillus shivajii]UCZ52801.1 ROK family transcriptional regulator [Bacillus shivajii]
MNILTFIQESDKNTKDVIKLVRRKGTVSRVDLASEMDIPKPTMTRIINKLIKNQILRESGLAESTGGRRPVLLEVNKDCAYSFGIDLGRKEVSVALINIHGDLVSLRNKVTSEQDTIGSLVSFIESATKDILSEQDVSASKLLGVGVGMPGPLNKMSEEASPHDFYGAENLPLRTMLEDALSLPVTIDNDANVALLAEKWFGKASGLQQVIYIYSDVGVGCGILMNGEIYRGMYGEAGEIGHSIIDVHGDRCECGKYGCLETFTSIKAIALRAEKKRKAAGNHVASKPAHFSQVIDDLNEGEPIARETAEEVAQYLGIAVVNVIQSFDPELVIIGGQFGQSHPVVVEKVSEVVRRNTHKKNTYKAEITTSELQNSIVLGGAALVINHAFLHKQTM